MNVNSILTKDYERNDIFAVPENKANSNPIKPNLLDAQMNVNTVITMNYEQITMNNANKNKPNSNPIPQPPFLTQKPTSPQKKPQKIQISLQIWIISVSLLSPVYSGISSLIF